MRRVDTDVKKDKYDSVSLYNLQKLNRIAVFSIYVHVFLSEIHVRVQYLIRVAGEYYLSYFLI